MDRCQSHEITHQIITWVEKRERLRTYEEGKILHNNAEITVPDRGGKKQLKGIIETTKKIKSLSKSRLATLAIEDSANENKYYELKEAQARKASVYILSNQNFKLTYFLNLTIRNNRIPINHQLNIVRSELNKQFKSEQGKKDAQLEMADPETELKLEKYALNLDD
jgi:hypothetical protein